jgi:deazaflavin-dependent oxidoreductase (nitroreductase family)
MSEPGYTKPDVSLIGPEHTRRYQETGGEIGYLWNGVPSLLLTTVGRRTGQRHTTPLIFGQDGADYLVVASQGGAPKHPLWYLNLLTTPQAEIQVRSERFPVDARPANDDEKPRLWRIMTTVWPNYDVYQTRTERRIPLVVLTPRSGSASPSAPNA